MAESKVKSSKLNLPAGKAGVQSLKKTGKAKSSVKTESKKEIKLTVPVFDVKGKEAGTMILPSEVFDEKINNILLAQAVRVYLANQRRGFASTKTRGDVRGSTRKIYRQKGTGRARHGARYAPIFVGGGVAHGPHPRDFSLDLPKKMKKKALISALSLKYKNNEIKIVDSIDSISAKTKDVVGMIVALEAATKRGKADKVLFVTSEKKEKFQKAARNIEGFDLEKANQLHVYEVINSKYLILVKDSIDVLKQLLIKS